MTKNKPSENHPFRQSAKRAVENKSSKKGVYKPRFQMDFGDEEDAEVFDRNYEKVRDNEFDLNY